MRRFMLLCLMLSLVSTACTKPQDGSGGAKVEGEQSLCGGNPRITGGHACADPGSSPVVLLVLADQNGQNFAICSGTLLTSDTILTAAHCVDRSAGIYKVYVDRSGELDLVPATATFKHPGWTGQAGNPNDVGIVKVAQPIATRSTAAILISSSPQINEDIYAYGYGIDENGDYQVLKEGHMKVSFFAENLIFAEYDRTKSSICSGDSGGPVTAVRGGGPAIIGINSAVAGETCLDGSIAAFADIAYESNLDFIMQHVPDVETR